MDGDAAGVAPQAVSEQQAAVVGLLHDLGPGSVLQLHAVLKPPNHQAILGRVGHLEGGVLPHADDDGPGELMEIVGVKHGHVCQGHRA